ncbi:MAG: recombinase, partial [Bacillati bacterium ANGP1]
MAWAPDGALTRVEDAGRALARAAGIDAAAGRVLPAAALDAVAGAMADLVVRVIAGQPLPDGGALWITEPLRSAGPFSHIVFSGGVAEYIYGFETSEFGDLGPRLAR